MKPKTNSMNKMILSRFLQNKLAVIGFIILVFLILFSFLTPYIMELDPDTSNMLNLENPPSSTNILGTDLIGRDMFARLVYGGQVSIQISLLATMLQLIIGTTLGIISGYFGGKVDFMIMRITDTFMCFPFFIIAIAISSIIQGSKYSIIIIIGALAWPKLCRLVRSQIVSLKNSEYIEAAIVTGVKPFNIVFKHIFPNMLPQILVYATISTADAIMTEAGLSYLGMGVKQPIPSWGNILSVAQRLSVLTNDWWIWVPPGIAIVLFIISINFLGDGLRMALTPKDSN